MSDARSLRGELDDRSTPLFRRYRSNLADLRVETKSDTTLLSEADLAIQTVIGDTILRHYPRSEFVAEEDDESGWWDPLREDQARTAATASS